MKYQFFSGISILVASITLSYSCKKPEIPYQISDEKLVNILTDIHISESAAQHLSLSIRDSMVSVYLEQILAIHEVEKEIFEPEYLRLKKDPKKIKKIYKKVTIRLNELKIDKKKEKKR